MNGKSDKVRFKIFSCKGVHDLLGLTSMISTLEKEYFSKVSVRHSTICREENNLVIEMQCPLGLHEILYHMQQGSWGEGHLNLVNKGIGVLRQSMQEIRDLNGLFLDVEEFSLILNDCSIVIKKISAESIEFELNNILSALGENYVFITRHMSMTPAEIFIPVYEEIPAEDEIMRLVSPSRIDEKGYFSYWGLYFDTDEEAVIYDLKNKKIISGDLELLN